ncbi:MAG TPA: SHOCT domain-containing protein, partial [Candidatus Limnocylindria bacterium]|nr:SHOCT domain-containing protein [Candidatus Limnocylindria bacterium]
VAMLNQKEMLERPDLAPPRYQRQGPAPDLQRAEPMPPRAGSDRVSQVAAGDGAPRSEMAAPSTSEPAAPRPRSSADELAETLEKLAGLRDRGFITAEEYEAKKRELLERM